METTKRNILYADTALLIAVYLLAVAWFFVPVGKPAGSCLLFNLRLALPALLLALGGFRLLSRLPTVGFLFCAIGDAMGVLGSFEGQMGGFAVAHLCFICWFAKGLRHSKPRAALFLATTLCCLLPLGVAARAVLPEVRDVPIRVGCVVYALLLMGTMWTSVVRAFAVQQGRGLRFVAAVGALLFVLSDFILAWNKFTAHIPHASLYIMTTYYAALLFLFVGIQTYVTKLAALYNDNENGNKSREKNEKESGNHVTSSQAE